MEVGKEQAGRTPHICDNEKEAHSTSTQRGDETDGDRKSMSTAAHERERHRTDRCRQIQREESVSMKTCVALQLNEENPKLV